MGVGAAIGAAALVSNARKARASDSKKFEGDKKPPRIDPDSD
jgi:hypothetical protein